MITKKSKEMVGGKPKTILSFHPERPQHVLSNDRIEFLDNETRMYRIGEKTFDADIYDRIFGVGNKKAKILPQNTKDPYYYSNSGMIPNKSGGRRARKFN